MHGIHFDLLRFSIRQFAVRWGCGRSPRWVEGPHLMGWSLLQNYTKTLALIMVLAPPVLAGAPPSRTGGGILATNKIILSPASSRADIETRLKAVREQETLLHREEQVLQADLQRVDDGVRDYLSATNSITDPDILALKRQLDEIEAHYRAVNSALAVKLQELPRFQGPFQMKRAAYFRLQQISQKVSELKGEQAILSERLKAIP